MSEEEFEFVPVVNFLFEISYPSLIILLPLQIRKCKKKKIFESDTNISLPYTYAHTYEEPEERRRSSPILF